MKPFSKQLQTIQIGYRRLEHDWTFVLASRLLAAAVLCTIALILWRWRSLPPEVPLWFSRPWGNDQLAAPVWLFLLPAGVCLLHGVNFLVSVFVIPDNRIFSQALFVTSVLMSVLSLITVIRILTLIT